MGRFKYPADSSSAPVSGLQISLRPISTLLCWRRIARYLGYYEARAEITKHSIEIRGYTAVTMKAPDATASHRYVRQIQSTRTSSDLGAFNTLLTMDVNNRETVESLGDITPGNQSKNGVASMV